MDLSELNISEPNAGRSQDEENLSKVNLLELWQPYVQDRYLGYDSKEERPIWGAIVHETQIRSKGSELIGPDEEFIDFLGHYFTENVVENVKAWLEIGAQSSLGSAYVKRGTLSSFVERLVCHIEYDVILGAESDSGEDQQHASKDTKESEAEEIQRKAGEDLDAEDLQDAEGQRNRSEQGGLIFHDPEGGSDHAGDGNPEDDQTGKCFFQAIGNFDIPFPGWDSPERITGDRKRSLLAAEQPKQQGNIQSRFKSFYDHLPEAVRASQYEPGEADSDSLVYLFHGTRAGHLPSFRKLGICPTAQLSDFSRSEAFYITNSLRYAFEHAVLNGRHGKKGDTVAVYCFLVPVGELHGKVPIASGYMIDSKVYSEGEKLTELFNYNWEFWPSCRKYHSVDVTIGPVSIPNYEKDKTGGCTQKKFGIVKIDEVSPLQLAFQSVKARSWLASKLVICYREV